MGNRLKTVQKNGAALAEFKYDGDGTRVQSTINGVTTKFVGEYYEITGATATKYYGGTAMRVGGVLYYLLSDHLGSNSLILDTAGNVVGETRYTACPLHSVTGWRAKSATPAEQFQPTIPTPANIPIPMILG